MNKENKFGAAAIAKLAMMTAVSVVLLLIIRLPFPPAPFLVYDPADVPIYITAFAFGPAAGLIVTLIVCLIQAFMLGGDGLYGFLMHFVATGIVAVVIGLMYSKCKTKKRAIASLAVAVVVATAVHGSSEGGCYRDASDCYYPIQSAQGRTQCCTYIHPLQEGQRFPSQRS